MSGPDFSAYLTHLGGVLRERNIRYGTGNITGPADVLGKVRDKMARLDRAVADGSLSPNDWTDLGGYAAIGWLLEQGKWDERSALHRVYFAHAIGEDEPKFASSWVRDLMEAAGFAVYWPKGAFHGAAGQAAWIWETNLEAIRGCDLVIAVIDGRAPGVAAEVMAARLWGKTVWVVAYAEPGSFVRWAAHRIFASMEGVFQHVKVSAPAARQVTAQTDGI